MSAVITRDSETREAKALRDAADLARDWKPSGVLPTIPDSKDWSYRWLREESQGVKDVKNINQRFEQGYRLVAASDMPDDLLILNEAKERGLIGTGGLLLARISKRAAAQRDATNDVRVKAEGASIDNDLFRDNAAHRKYTPAFQGRGHGVSTVTAGRGKV